MRIIFGFVVLLFTLSACSGGDEHENSSQTLQKTSADGETGSASIVAADYRKSFDRAWKRAGDGKSPTSACAGVVGRAVGMLKTSATDGQPKADALTALNACYVLAMARYVDTRLSADSQGSALCIDLLKALPVHRRSLGGFLEDVGENKAAYDRRLNDQIGNKVRAACPDAATVLLGA
ncbi:hypothetical protein [Parasphingorhabdus sp.]|uniref:hypothetical protein n=1 Tax=Parasphingorhabdus sp. TaxID=2709688 RepID=UPI003A945A03